MPLIGLIDRDGKCIEWDKIAKGKGNFEDPAPMLIALYSERDDYCDFSITTVMNDPYYVQMLRRFEYFERPDDMGDRLLGIGLHALMEKSAGKCVAAGHKTVTSETKHVISVEVPYRGKKVKVTLGGTCDLDLVTSLWDYKTITMGALKYMVSGRSDKLTDYMHQLNGYRWLKYVLEGRDIKTLRVRAFVKDWRFSEFRHRHCDLEQYPRGVVIPVETMPMPKVEEYFKQRLALHVAAERVSDERLHTVGECDTWSDRIRCNFYCPLKSVCWFRMNEGKSLRKEGK